MDGFQKRTEAKKTAILDAAKELFGKHGFRKVSVEEIAERAGVSKVSIYSYFRNKEGLIEALVGLAFDERKSAIGSLLRSDLPFPRKLQGLILQKTDTAEGFSREFLEQMLEHPAWKNQPMEEIHEMMFEFFDQGRAEGHIVPDVSNRALLTYVEVFKSGAEAHSGTLAALGPDEVRSIISMFFRGITAGAAGA